MITRPETFFYNCLAITGGIGSGKSIVLNYFKEKGYLTVSADDIVTHIYSGRSEYSIEYFKEVDSWLHSNFAEMGYIDKKILRNTLNKTENGLAKIADIALPYIEKSMQDIYLKNFPKQQMVMEVPLLVEKSLHLNFQHVLVIYTEKEIKIERIKKRNPYLNNDEINNLINAQMSDEEKIKVANYVVDNSKDIPYLYQQLDIIAKDLKKENKAKYKV